MKSEVKKLEGLTRKLSVEVAPEVVNQALEKMYQEVQKSAKFKGFRPGKAPLNMVKLEYRSQVERDVAARIIQDHYGKALDEHQLDPVNYPEIEFDGLIEGQPLKFTAVFEVRPDIALKKYEGLSVEKEKLEFKDEMVDGIVEEIRKGKASMVPLFEVRPVQMGDVAVIDFVGRKDGVEFPNGSAKEHFLELGAKQFIDGFEEGIVGMNPGETRKINVTFPADYHETALAGQPVEFEVNLKEIKVKRLPELNDEFAKSIGEHTSLENLREEIKKDVLAREEKRVFDDFKNRVLHTLVDANPFDVPKTMVQEQKKVLVDDVHHRMEQQGMPHEQFEEYQQKWDEDFTKSAEFVVRSSLLINTVAKKENLFSSEEEFTAKLEGYAKQTGIELEKVKAFYAKPEQRSRLRFQMTEEKVINFLIGKATVKEVSKDKLKKLDN